MSIFLGVLENEIVLISVIFNPKSYYLKSNNNPIVELRDSMGLILDGNSEIGAYACGV